MRFLLDTNVLSELRKPKPHGGVLAWLNANEAAGLAIPAVALFEIQMGIEKVRENDPLRGAAFDSWVTQIGTVNTILPMDAEAARETARLLRKLPMTFIADAMIAATAKVNSLTVATRNIRDFKRFDVPVVNPFEFKG